MPMIASTTAAASGCATPSTNARSSLIPSSGEAPQVPERRVARAEVVEQDPHAEAAQQREHRAGGVDLLHQRALGHLECESVRRQAGVPQRGLDVAGQLAARDLERGHVDRRPQVLGAGQLRAPAGDPAARLAEHEPPELADQAAALGERDEDRGRHRSALGMRPARERLDRTRAPVAQVEDRLERHVDLARAQRAAEVALEPQPLQRAGAQHVVVDLDAAAARRLRVVQRRVGLAQQLAVGRADGDAHRARDVDVVAGEVERLGPGRRDPAGVRARLPRSGHAVAEDEVAAAAEVLDGVLGADGCAQPRGKLDQQRVARVATQRGVHVTEPVEIDEQCCAEHVFVIDPAVVFWSGGVVGAPADEGAGAPAHNWRQRGMREGNAAACGRGEGVESRHSLLRQRFASP